MSNETQNEERKVDLVTESKKHNPLKITHQGVLNKMAYAESISPLKGMTKKQKKKEIKMTEEEKEINRKILYNMNLKLNFVKNPRYREIPIIPSFTNTNFSPIDSKDNPFFIEPKEVIFRDYQTGCVYQIDLKILNRTQLLTSFKYVPPITENFTIKEVIYPKKDSALIAPGMFAKMQILFNATSMENFQDELIIITEKMSFKVPLKGIRDKPALSLSNPMDCKKCFIGDRVEMHFMCKNNGGDAHFRFFPADEEEINEDSNQVTANELLTIGPFTVFPQEFFLYKGMAQNITVNFAPDKEGIIKRKVNLICENSNLNYVLKGEGIKVDIAIKSIDGLCIEKKEEEKEENEDNNNPKEVNSNGKFTEEEKNEERKEYADEENKDTQNAPLSESNIITDEKKEKHLDLIFFIDTYPHTSASRIIVLKNTCSVPVKFHWSIYDIYHQDDFTMLPDETFFSIEPEDGKFEAFQEIEFTIKFTPLNSKIYEQKLDLVIENIPFPAIKQFISPSTTIKNSFTKAEPYLPGFNSSFPSYPLYSFNLCGRGKLPYLETERNYIDLGNIYLNEEIIDSITITNPRTGIVTFKPTRIIQKLLTKKKEDNDINRFYKNNALDESILFKNKVTLSQKENAVPIDLNLDDDFKTNLLHTNVEFLQLSTNECNFSDYIIKHKAELTSAKSKENSNSNSNSNNDIVMQKLKNRRTKPRYTQGKNKTKKTTQGNDVKSTQSKQVPLSIDQTLQINQGQTVNIDFKFKGAKIGYFKGVIIFELSDGIAFTIDIRANIIGPSIEINTPSIDFGLFPVSEIRQYEFEIENTSPIPLKYLIKESRYTTINLSNYIETNFIESFEGELEEKDKIYRDKIETILEYNNQEMLTFDVEKKDCYIMKFSSVIGELNPYEKRIIKTTFISPFPIQIPNDRTIQVDIENGESKYINFKCQCEEAKAYIENTMIIPKEIFLTMPIQFEDNTITIINPSNLPINFKWDNVFEADKILAEFEPNNGMIPPHSTQKIKFKIVYYEISEIDDMYICHINEMDIPLGIIVQGSVTGLDIAYEFTEESAELMKDMNEVIVRREPKRRPTRRKTRLSSLMVGPGQTEEEIDKTMKEIKLRGLKVNTPQSIEFTIKNLSGIPTQFAFSLENYAPGREKDSKVDKEITSTNITKLTKLSKRTYKNSNFKIDHLLLSAAHEEINFTSPKGCEFTKKKQIEKDSILYLSNKKGVAIVLEPTKGSLPPHGECLVKVSVFNECVGEFFDMLSSSVKGLPIVKFPVDLKIKGNPLQLSPFQPGINYLLEPPLLKMGYIIRNSGQIVKKVKLVNIGTNTIALNWTIFDYEDYMNPKDRKLFNIKIHEKTAGQFSLQFLPENPKGFPPEKEYFTISPLHGVIGPKETMDFTLTFKTDEVGEKNALFIAYPKIEGDTEGKVKFNELPVKVSAGGLIPHLVVDKRQTIEGKYEYIFVVHSYGLHPLQKRSIILINKEKINMIVKLSINGPFKIERTEPFEASLDNMTYNIIPNSNLKLDVRYQCPSPSNEREWPMTLINEKTGILTVTFENGEYEQYYLKAILKRPRIQLSLTGNAVVESLNYIDFGYVNCASRKILNIYLMNETEVDTNWRILYSKFVPKQVYGYGTITKEEEEDLSPESDNQNVFSFDVTDGVIYGPTDTLINLPIGPGLPRVETFEGKKYRPFIIKVMFKPIKNIFYKCRYKITTSTGNVLSFYLKGFGSYLEEHIIEQN